MTLLERILASKRGEVERLRSARSAAAQHARDPLDVLSTLRRGPGDPLRLVAEVKFKSPSAGPLSRALGPGERALAYARAGARMVSVLCDAPFFDGGYHHLAEARAALDEAALAIPLLAKEFVVDQAQIDAARDAGADAVLVIARVLTPSRVAALVGGARALGLEPIVEVIDEAELESAVTADARVVGVNARDLDALSMDPERAARVLAAIPEGIVAMHLSGLRTAVDVADVANGRADAALVGEALMRLDDPTELLAAMVAAAG